MIAVLLCTALLGIQDPVRVSASLTSSRINVGGTTELQVTVETRGAAPEEIRLPQLSSALEIIGTSDFTQSQISIPGGRTLLTRRQIVILARSPGVYRIPSVIVRVAGATYRTDPLDLVVTGGGVSPPSASLTSSTLDVSLDPDTVYVGEQVLLRVEATFVEDMRTRQTRPATFDPPAPTGFWVQDLPDPISVTLRASEGRTIETQTYRRAYFPLAPGIYRFPPARLHYEVRRGFLYAPETRELVSDSARLVVLPVPGRGQPARYNGAVGRLSMRTSISPRTLRTGEATVLTVEVEGTGNIKALPEPQLPEIQDADVLPQGQDSRVDIQDDRVGGMKRFRWMIIANEPGRLVIPPIEYAVFDPELRTYVVLRSDTLHVNVTHLAAVPADTALRPLKLRPATAPLPWVDSPMFRLAQVLPLLALAGAFVVRRRRSTLAAQRDDAAALRERIRELRRDPASPRLPADLERIVRDAVATMVASEGDPIAALRAQKRPAAAAELEALLGELQRLRFAPAATYDRRLLIDRVEAFIGLIAPRRGNSGAHALIALLAVMLPIAGTAVQDSDEHFFEGVQEYERGDYAAALNSFQHYADAMPDDPAGWYNTGLAAQRAGEPGRAAWAWLRTIRIAPRDADARHNLITTGAVDALERVRPVDRLSHRERALIASIGWWLLALAATLIIVRPDTRRVIVLPGAVLLLFAGTTSAIEAARPMLVTPLRDEVQLHAAPVAHDELPGALRAGSVARVVDDREDWLRIRTDAGQDAWIERDAVAEP